MSDERKYWFPAKTYGWGWGPPTTWQGWVVLIVFLLLIVGGIPIILPRFGALAFNVYVAVLALALLCICWLTGERPHWRWGKR